MVVKQEAEEEQAEYEQVRISCGPTTRLANASSLQGSHFDLMEPSRITGDDVKVSRENGKCPYPSNDILLCTAQEFYFVVIILFTNLGKSQQES